MKVRGDTIGTVPVPWAGQVAISNAKILIYIFSYKIYGSNFIKQHSDSRKLLWLV